MKILHKFVALVLIIVLINTNSGFVFAHQEMLNIGYDDCDVPVDDEGNIIETDGEDETWYWLIWNRKEYHLSHETITIKYYFANSSIDDTTYTWTNDVSEAEANAIKEAYANSMKKWNNVYYYSYDEQGNRMANKIINIIEGTENDHNLTIYPRYAAGSSVASVLVPNESGSLLGINNQNIAHYHYENWEMKVNIYYFREEYSLSSMIREAVGMHEMGHILGIYDVDVCCSSYMLDDHHEEILMGYGDGNRSTYAKYKDIAGVSITRGFHTDADHIWMLRINTDGTQDVICAQCNGVRKNITLTNGKYEGKTVNIYKSCVHHGGANKKMLLVATDGTRDFYKCQYCRYISEVDHSTHYYANSENINATYHFSQCVSCNYARNIPHNIRYSNITDTSHTKKCTDCGYSVTQSHFFEYQTTGSLCHILKCRYCVATSGSSEAHVWTANDIADTAKCKICNYIKFLAPGEFVPIIKTKIEIEEETE